MEEWKEVVCSSIACSRMNGVYKRKGRRVSKYVCMYVSRNVYIVVAAAAAVAVAV
jgi:hypothetical protein